MKTKTYIRILLVVLVASTSLILFSYSRKKVDTNVERSTECGGKGCEQKTQSDFILWESLTRNLLSARG
ncbi:MAG TPA: hypothetical protein VHC96_01050 [Puia sp.]|jgi:hypothetical protein|nr:hypothetical protein [Puia sp.]